MSERIEDYAFIGDLQTAALVSRGGSIDWFCVPRFDSCACFAALLGNPDHGRWLLAPVSETAAIRRRYVGDSLVLETEHETPDGIVTVTDFMPFRTKAPDIVRIVEGKKGRVRMRSELVIRFDYGSITPWVRRRTTAFARSPGRTLSVLRTPRAAPRRGLQDGRRIRRRAGSAHSACFDLARVVRTAAETGRRRNRLARNPRLLAELGQPLRLRRALEGRRRSLPDHSEGADVRADRRRGGGRDDITAGKYRRRPQLGLPLLLAPRRHLFALQRCSIAGTPRKRKPGGHGCSGRSPAIRPPSRSCTAWPASAA